MIDGGGVSFPKIKICGLSRIDDIEVMNAVRPDYVGFVFVRSSSRYVTPERVAALRARLDDDIVTVGVFKDADMSEITRLAADGTIRMAQLHGGEDAEYISRLRERCAKAGLMDVQVIKALSAEALFNNRVDDDRADVFLADIAHDGSGRPDFLLVDNGDGGTGRSFDWSALRGRHRDGLLYPGDEGVGLPFFLAGGVGEGNIEDAICMAPYGIDVSSGVETDGVKDADKIKRLVEAVRSRRRK
ncbi:MAG: phosphoribosylanthranilate isomerase [Clostridiales Family XIII bacterium]|nr:phosphoribosylanthranilate isomerase [Clostridiales Family XIII bacterium]